MANKKILIVNRCHTENLGDQYIGRSMENIFSQYGQIYKADLVHFYNKDQELNCCNIKHRHSLSTLLIKLRLRTVNQFVKVQDKFRFNILRKHRFDYIIFGGGELINSSFSQSLCEWSDNISKYQPTAKVYIFAVGVTDNFSPTQKKETMALLRKACSVYVRDINSKRNLYTIFGLDSLEIPDSVFYNLYERDCNENLYSLYGISEYKRLVLKHNNKFSCKDDYYNMCIKDIEHKEKSGHIINLFYTTKADLEEVYEFNDYCKSTIGKEYAIAKIYDLDSLLSCILCSYAVFSPRMHACIIALIMHKHVEPIIISEKMRNFKEKYIDSKIDLFELKQLLQQAGERVVNDIENI